MINLKLKENGYLNKRYQYLKKDFGVFTGISLGIFLFVLFFQPFSLAKFDFNNRMLFVAGLAGIVFLVTLIVRVFFSVFIINISDDNQNNELTSYINGFLIWALSAVGFTFYIRYIGSVDLTFYIMFKIIIICLLPPLILKIRDDYKLLTQQNMLLHEECKILKNRLKIFEENTSVQNILFTSEHGTEKINLPASSVIMIKSADNYVEVIYKANGNFKKEMIRNTMKNIEQQVKKHANFIRCHRTTIVNIFYAEKLYRENNNYWLNIKDYNEQIPVSRQYLIYIKDAMNIQKG